MNFVTGSGVDSKVSASMVYNCFIKSSLFLPSEPPLQIGERLHTVSRCPVGKRQKAAEKPPPFDLPPPLARMARSGGGLYSISICKGQGPPCRANWGCHKTERSGRGGPLDCIYTAPYLPRIPGAGSIPDRRWPRLHSPAVPFYRIPQDSPSSLWEGVSKSHYLPRCPRAWLATAGSKACVDRSVSSYFTSLELSILAARLLPLSRGFCIWNTVYSVVSGRGLSLLTYQAENWGKVLSPKWNFPKYFSGSASPGQWSH